MTQLDYRLYLAPPSGGSFEEFPLESFSLVIDPKDSLGDSLEFRTRIPYDPEGEPKIESGRIPGTGAMDGGARVELWLGTRRLFAGVVDSFPRRDRWRIEFVAHNVLWRLGRSVAVYQGEAEAAAIFEPCYLRPAVQYPAGTLEIDPELGSPPQTEGYGERGRRGWKLGPFILESNTGGDFEQVDASTFEVAPHKGLLSVTVDYDEGAQYRLRRVAVLLEGTHEVEDILSGVLSYSTAIGGPGLDSDNFDFEETGVTVASFVQHKSTGYVSELVSELTGERYARGYRIFAGYHYDGVQVGDPVKIIGRNVYQAVPPDRTITTARQINLDQPTSLEDIAARVVSTVRIMQPGNLLKTASIENLLEAGDGWEPIYPNSGSPAVLNDGLTDEIYGKFKESEQGNYVAFVSFSMENPAIIERIILTPGTAKGKGRILAYSVFGSAEDELPSPDAGGWEPIKNLFEAETKPATLGAGLIQPESTLDVRIDDPRIYKHLLVKSRGYKWGSSSKEGSVSMIELQAFGRTVQEFEAALQDSDPFGGQAIGPETALTGTLTFGSGSNTVTGIGTAFLSEITAREIADGVAIKLASKDSYLRVIEVVNDTALKLAGNCPAESAGAGASEKSSFLNTYKPELLASLSAVGPMTFIDDNETEEDAPGAYLRAFLVLDEKSRFYQGVTAELAPDETIEPFETVLLADDEHNIAGIPVLVERIERSVHKITINGVNYRA